MSSHSSAEHLSRPIDGEDDLLRIFHDAAKRRDAWRIGVEAEKFGVCSDDASPLQYEGPRGVKAVLNALMQRYGWLGERETSEGEIIALRRDGASITLEPGGQVELSGAPLATLHQADAEFRRHMDELRAIGRDLGIVWLGLGFHPFASRNELPWVPKLRYGIMRDYLPTRGSMALDMMLRTCTVQANLDYADEQDAMRKLRLALRLQPLTTALFANSPWVEGKAVGDLSYRGRVWLHMDHDRSGLLPFAWKKQATFRDYAEWALDVPMFLVRRGERFLPNTRQTFRQFLRDGCQGERATLGDWQTHLNTLFPEVRLKGVIEVRGADNQRSPLIMALPALWKGLLYDDVALQEAEDLTEGWSYEQVNGMRPQMMRDGLQSRLQDRTLASWSQEVLQIATGGLQRLGQRNAAGEDEAVYLSALRQLVDAGITPAEQLLEAVARQDHNSATLEQRIVAASQV